MSDDLTKPPSADLALLQSRAVYFAQSTVSDKVKRMYAVEYGHFVSWATKLSLGTEPPEVGTVAMYLAALADGHVEIHYRTRWGEPRVSKKACKWAYIQHVYNSIGVMIRAAGHEWPKSIPAITAVMHGIKYRKGAKVKRMAPLEIADLRACILKTRERRFEDLTVLRDRALLSLGFFAALRRKELVAICVEHLTFVPEGMILHIPNSKTDQFAEGVDLGITPQTDKQICPIELVRKYLEVSEIKAGPIFRRIDSRSDCYGDKALTPGVVMRIVKEYAERAGLDPDRFAGHSLRAGFATTAADKGRTLTQIMRQGRWKDQRTAQTYIRPATIFADNPTAGLSDDPETCRHNWVIVGRNRWCPTCDVRQPAGGP